jgi:hypothetical protein
MRRGTRAARGAGDRGASSRDTRPATPWSQRSPAGCHRLASKIWPKVGSRIVRRPLPSRAGEEIPASSANRVRGLPPARELGEGSELVHLAGVSHPRRSGREVGVRIDIRARAGPCRCPTPCPRRARRGSGSRVKIRGSVERVNASIGADCYGRCAEGCAAEIVSERTFLSRSGMPLRALGPLQSQLPSGGI